MRRIVFPESWTTDVWYGFTRHSFDFEGCKAWVVEPEFPAGDGRWSWCTVWPESFVKRVGTLELLEHGFYHAHVDAFQFRASPEGIALMGRFQELLVNLGLSPKANLIGMSWGGFFSLRYAETFPDRVCAIYLDAPVCNAADPEPNAAKRLATILENYHLSFEEMAKSKLNPLNNVGTIVEAGIPLFDGDPRDQFRPPRKADPRTGRHHQGHPAGGLGPPSPRAGRAEGAARLPLRRPGTVTKGGAAGVFGGTFSLFSGEFPCNFPQNGV